MAEVIEGGRTGLQITPGGREDLATKVDSASNNSERTLKMGREARAEYEAKYTAERNYQIRTEIYHKAIGMSH